MAHGIEKASDMIADGNRAAPWHGVYTPADGLQTVDSARDKVFDWEPTEQPIVTLDADGNPIPIETHKAIVRSDNARPLGVVGADYGVISNSVIAEAAKTILGDGAVIETAGNIRGGARVWYLARNGEDYKVGNDDSPVRPYTLLASSHDGSLVLHLMDTDTRVVCNNTLTWAIEARGNGAGTGVHKIRHTRNGVINAQDAARTMAASRKYHGLFRDWANAMAREPWNAAEQARLVKALLPTKDEDDVPTITQKNRDRLAELFDTGDGHDSIRGTAWAAINAVTQWADHERNTRGRDLEARRDNRLQSVWFGSGAKLKARAARLVTEYVATRAPAGPAGYVGN